MKTKLFFLILVFYSAFCLSQVSNGVELQINIIQKFNNGQLETIALNTNVVNNTGKKIYIPNLSFFLITIEVYKKTDGLFMPINGVFMDITSKNLKDGVYVPPKNAIGQVFSKISTDYYDKKMSRFKSECEKNTKDKDWCLQINDYNFGTKSQDFLEPNETIDFRALRGLDNLQKMKGDYKFFFDFESTLKFVKNKSLLKHTYPAEFYHDIMGYELFLPENMTSNVVYITIL
jgi:hypothetical protein